MWLAELEAPKTIKGLDGGVAGLQQMNTELAADRVQLREPQTIERRKFRQQEAKLAADAEATESKLRVDLMREYA